MEPKQEVEITSQVLLPVDGPRCELAESPRWDGVAWWWLDVPAGAVYRMVPGAAAELMLRTGRRASFLAPLGPGRLVLAEENRLQRLRLVGGTVRIEPRIRVPLPAGWLLNDGCLGPDGSIWVGSVAPAGADGRRPATGSLIRVTTHGEISAPVSGFALSNGLGWIDSRTLLHADSGTGIVWRHRFDTAFAAIESKEYLRIPAPEGLPDGLAIDSAGLIWLAVYGAGEVRAIRDGRTVARVPVPTAQTTAVAVGGLAGDELLVTTAREGYDDVRSAAEPLAGRIFHGTVSTMNASEERG
ncbi:SMP-30/gluconolactonase/LRE family protein [Kribbella sp. GL6]|uniref:SMP-30/gluconolactonase/LRE family protein n=1 Tax=Kribbella sp. GL6 TaxID=3419765 RepID=UPI003D0015F1